MTAVLATTEQLPELEAIIAHRHATGQDRYDEWRDGVYCIVTGPSPEHGEMLAALTELFGPLVRARGLKHGGPINIGRDKEECRVSDWAVYRPDTPKTSPAFLATAELVVEVLSPGERAGAKLPLYMAWGIKECLEIDLKRGTVALWSNDGTGGWMSVRESKVLAFHVTKHEVIETAGRGSVPIRILE